MRFVVFLSMIFISINSYASNYPITWKKSAFPGSVYIVPNDSKQHTSIILLHGSEGGSTPYLEGEASLLAAQGYAVLLYCYFDCGRGLVGPRATLKDVEVTKVLDASAWLRTQSNSNGKVVVYGFSRGAELAMIVGSLSATVANQPDALIAHSPSDTFNPAWNWSWEEPSCWITSSSGAEWNPACGFDDPTKNNQTMSAWKVSGVTVSAGRRIEIEKFGRPILITVGEEDEVWSVDQTRRIEATLRANGRPLEIRYFPAAGHSFRAKDEIPRRELVLDFLERVP